MKRLRLSEELRGRQRGIGAWRCWYLGGSAPGPAVPNSSQDIGLDVQATFLFHP